MAVTFHHSVVEVWELELFLMAFTLLRLREEQNAIVSITLVVMETSL